MTPITSTPNLAEDLDAFQRAVYLATGEILTDTQLAARAALDELGVPWYVLVSVMRPATTSLANLAVSAKRAHRRIAIFNANTHGNRSWRNHPQRRARRRRR